MEEPNADELISGAEFARRLGVNRSAVTRYVQAGILVPVTRRGGLRPGLQLRASDVERIRTLGGSGETEKV